MKKSLYSKFFSSEQPSNKKAAAPETVAEPFRPVRKPENGDTLPGMFFMTGEPEDGPGIWASAEELRWMGEPEDHLSAEERLKWAQAVYPGADEPDDEMEP